MKAAVWHGYKDIRIENKPIPKPSAHQVLVKVDYAGICGTDRHEYVGPNFIPTKKPHRLTGKMAPLVMGHEFSGRIDELGEDVKKFSKGDRVTANGSLSCGECEFCKEGRYNICKRLGFIGVGDDGCFAEYIVVEESKLFLIPDGVSQRQAAVAEPIACGIHATNLIGNLTGKTVIVIGVGIIGIGAFYGAKLAGASHILVVGRNNNKKAFIEKHGGYFLNVSSENLEEYTQEWSDGLMADVVYECAGTQETMDMCIPVCKPGGTIMVMGVFEKPPTIDINTLQEAERTIMTSQAHIHEIAEALEYIRISEIDAEELITKEVTLDTLVEEGFEELIQNSSKHIKILINLNK
ncbi:MAG: L-iditol 2-dehydrogenase [Clostridia bacterium]|nr:L-iditol 2-dehydrogenase [Clostridia bacterium]